MDDSILLSCSKLKQAITAGSKNASACFFQATAFSLSCARGAVAGAVEEEEQPPGSVSSSAGNEDTTDVTGLGGRERAEHSHQRGSALGTFSSSLE